ncbi:(d)CMP kinase [Parvularcula dongshanensis]|uniref:Cytidylate kinase n=1 Tax=Parvularcula dongshanensis TaxID=1173995 RepID=A0A840HYJ6_9PROT|nr:cytidylate kinase [Parvularcula dongshanensis]
MTAPVPEEVRPLVIAVDGPAAAGKGTLSRRLAGYYGLAYLDTGTLYRGVGWLMMHRNLDPRNAEEAAATAQGFSLDLVADADIRTGDVGKAASVVAVQPAVRAALLQYQRDFAARPPKGTQGAILDGRDIGTVVCPDATVKLYVTASDEARAERRWRDLTLGEPGLSLSQVLEDIRRRDARDSSRAEAPLRPAPGAHLLDTTSLSIDAAFAAARRVIDRALGDRRAE